MIWEFWQRILAGFFSQRLLKNRKLFCFAEFYQFFCYIKPAFATLIPNISYEGGDASLFKYLPYFIQLFICISIKSVDCYKQRKTELPDIFNMLLQIFQAPL